MGRLMDTGGTLTYFFFRVAQGGACATLSCTLANYPDVWFGPKLHTIVRLGLKMAVVLGQKHRIASTAALFGSVCL